MLWSMLLLRYLLQLHVLRLLRSCDLTQTFNSPDPEVKDESMSECGKCFGCEVCIKCEKFGPQAPRQPARQPIGVQPAVCRPQGFPQPPPIDEQRIRQIVLEILIELGLIPEARKRAKITPSE